ncbi:hypothetical protein HPB52_023366 [Rhipicephalus sanguineus]|uniref:Endonuclease/exonuclease/phosphatase domain-containing protein n=1 Tax=Rhipicephalus sanguineus TaxID=34632 RepID=A0A9D4QC35_RHISA|nr:hypothetical protein HPB52_023366 [Rhipicephalus sanguineus]
MLLNGLLWDSKPPPVKRHPESCGGLGLRHMLTTAQVFALKTARSLYQAPEYLCRKILLYWASTNTRFLDAVDCTGPRVESPSPFYKAAMMTQKVWEKEVPDCKVDAAPPARIVEDIALAHLSPEEKSRIDSPAFRKARRNWKLPRVCHDFEFKRLWNVLPSKQRLHLLGIVPSAKCPNCHLNAAVPASAEPPVHQSAAQAAHYQSTRYAPRPGERPATPTGMATNGNLPIDDQTYAPDVVAASTARFRKRSYVAAARGVLPTAGDTPEGDRDNNQPVVAQTATSPSEAQATLQESSDTDGATTVTVDSATEASSTETSRESWPDARSATKEQEVPQIAEQLDDNGTPTPQLDNRNVAPLPPAIVAMFSHPHNGHDRSATGSSPRHPRPSTSSAASSPPAPCAAPPGLEKRHRSRSRQRQTDANKSAKTGRAGSQEMRRSQGKVASSDSDAPPQAKAPKLGETPPGGNEEPPDGGVNKAPTVTAMAKIRFATWNVRGFRDRAKQQEVLRFAGSQAIDLFIQETNFRTPLEVVTFRRDHQVDAFFSLTRTRACAVGVIFVSGRFRQKPHCMFDGNGRTIMLDVFIDGKKIRFVNIYAPVTRSNTNNYFKEVHQLLLEPLPHVLRDVRCLGQGGSTYYAKEHVKVVRHLNLSDVWVHLYKDSFAPTRMSRYTASRIDRMYLPELLLPSVEACEVLDLPDNLVGKTDHVPLVTTVRGNTSWRVDPALLQEQESIDRTREFLQVSIERTDQITPPVWDRLKIEWKAFL